jgi:hypothetical protein
MNQDCLPPQVRSSVGDGIFKVIAEVKIIGDDLMISVWGGTKPHIGSISVSVPRPGLQDNTTMSATSSIINLIGHKDEVVARKFSEQLAAKFNKNAIATAGIHIDDITENQINILMQNMTDLCRDIMIKLEEIIK